MPRMSKRCRFRESAMTSTVDRSVFSWCKSSYRSTKATIRYGAGDIAFLITSPRILIGSVRVFGPRKAHRTGEQARRSSVLLRLNQLCFAHRNGDTRSLGAGVTPSFVLATTLQLENGDPPAVYHGAWCAMAMPPR